MERFIILIGIIVLVSIASATETTCSSCEDCNNKLDGSYDAVNLDVDITGHSGTCITIGSGGVEFDCQNHIIDGGDSSDTYGIYSNGKSHVTIKNCVITDFQMGIQAEGASNLTITSNNASSNLWDGIYLKYVNDSLLSYNVLESNDDGLYLDSSNGNTVSGNTMTSNSYSGIILLNSDSNVLSSNEACSNGDSDFYLYSGSGNSGDINMCDTASGWNDDGATGCTYSCGETTTSISTTTTSTSTSSTTSTLPEGETTCSSCSDCTAKLDGSYDVVGLDADIADYNDTCIEFGADNVEFDCQGHTIDGDDSFFYSGVYMYGMSGNTVKNCIVTDFKEGIYLLSSSNNTITSNTADSNNYDGIFLLSSSSNILTNNTASNNNYGIGIWASSSNTLTNNTASNNYNGIHLESSSSNTLNSNQACSSTNFDFYLSSSSGNSGDDNSCGNSQNWNDTGTTGCTYTCSGGCLKGDADCDGSVSDFEILSYITAWTFGGATDFDLLEAIDNWANG